MIWNVSAQESIRKFQNLSEIPQSASTAPGRLKGFCLL